MIDAINNDVGSFSSREAANGIVIPMTLHQLAMAEQAMMDALGRGRSNNATRIVVVVGQSSPNNH
jgi:hypothetical protein